MGIQQYTKDGVFDPAAISVAVKTTPEDIATTIGLTFAELEAGMQTHPQETQKKLRELAEILNKVTPRFGAAVVAYAWLRSEPLAGFGGMTAMHLLLRGQAKDVLDYIDAVDAGVHA